MAAANTNTSHENKKKKKTNKIYRQSAAAVGLHRLVMSRCPGTQLPVACKNNQAQMAQQHQHTHSNKPCTPAHTKLNGEMWNSKER